MLFNSDIIQCLFLFDEHSKLVKEFSALQLESRVAMSWSRYQEDSSVNAINLVEQISLLYEVAELQCESCSRGYRCSKRLCE